MKAIAKEIIDEIVDELYGKRILSNLTRPLYVEKLLVRLLGADWHYVGGDWSGWDLEHTQSHRVVDHSLETTDGIPGPTVAGMLSSCEHASSFPLAIQRGNVSSAHAGEWLGTPD